MECRLSYSPESFRCQISLRIETDEHGTPVADVREVKFGGIVTDKRYAAVAWILPIPHKLCSLVEKMLRRAQLAILNPFLPSDYFLDVNIDKWESGQPTASSKGQLQFSSNVVCISKQCRPPEACLHDCFGRNFCREMTTWKTRVCME